MTPDPSAPTHKPFTLNSVGSRAYSIGDFATAERAYIEALRLHERFPTCWSNLGLVYQQAGDDHKAQTCYQRALEHDGDHIDALCNLGFLMSELGYMDHAHALFKKVARLKPDHQSGPANLCLSHMMKHEFAQGWEHMGHRFTTKPPTSIMRPYNIPLWDGRPTKKLAIWPEQGLGDQILFASLLPDLVAREQHFALELAPRLVPIFQRSFPNYRVMRLDETEDGGFSGCTSHIPLGSLGAFLRPDAASFVGKHSPFLASDERRTEEYRSRLGLYAPRRAVAVSWRSFQKPTHLWRQRKKTAPLEAFSELSRRDDIQLVGVQYGDVVTEITTFVGRPTPMTTYNRLWTPAQADLDKFNDVDGVISLIDACDAVITTSNVSAHYAGALGKPTYLIFPNNNWPCWYWAPGPDGRCLWYPSVRIVSAPDVSDWATLVGMAESMMREDWAKTEGAEAPPVVLPWRGYKTVIEDGPGRIQFT